MWCAFRSSLLVASVVAIGACGDGSAGTGPSENLNVDHIPASPFYGRIAFAVQTDVVKYVGPGWGPVYNADSIILPPTLSADTLSDTMTLTGAIPGITPESRLFFETFDYNPGGTPQMDVSSCGSTGP